MMTWGAFSALGKRQLGVDNLQVEVRVFGGLEKFLPGVRFGQPVKIEVSESATVGILLKELGIPPEYIHAVLVNGRHAELGDRLVSGDRVSLFPPIGGG